MRGIFQAIAALIAMGAGIYLLQYSGAPINVGGQTGRSWFDIIDHGIGAYFVARGLWMFTEVEEIAGLRKDVARLVELREWEVSQEFDSEGETEQTDDADE